MEASWQDLAAGAAVLSLDDRGRPEQPLILLDLDHLGPPPLTLPTATAVVVGITDATPPTETLPYLTCWVSPDEVTAVKATVKAAPIAALVLASVLAEPITTAADALRRESMAYSMLLAGAEFQTWLASRRTSTSAGGGASEPVTFDREGNVLTITLARPERHNAYSAAMRDGLRNALEIAVADPSLEVVLRGAGPSFCSGGDLTEFGLATDPATAHLIRTVAGTGALLAQLGDRARAEVHGACVGAGIELAAFAGQIQADADSWFHLPELGMGLIPGAGGTVSIPSRIGRWRTAQLALTQRRIDATTALAWGLVDAITD